LVVQLGLTGLAWANFGIGACRELGVAEIASARARIKDIVYELVSERQDRSATIEYAAICDLMGVMLELLRDAPMNYERLAIDDVAGIVNKHAAGDSKEDREVYDWIGKVEYVWSTVASLANGAVGVDGVN
jgi:hypothetical protein